MEEKTVPQKIMLKYRKRTLLFPALLLFGLTIFSLYTIFKDYEESLSLGENITQSFKNFFRGKDSLLLDDEIQYNLEPTEEMLEVQRILDRGYRFNRHINMKEGISYNMLGIDRLEITSYRVEGEKIIFNMIWYLGDLELDVITSSESFVVSSPEGNGSGEYIVSDPIRFDSDLEQFLKLNYIYQGNFKIEGIEEPDEDLIEEFINGDRNLIFVLELLSDVVP